MRFSRRGAMPYRMCLLVSLLIADQGSAATAISRQVGSKLFNCQKAGGPRTS